MALFDIERDRSAVGNLLPRVVAILGGAGFVTFGVWAMVDPQSFFEALARFEPYNQHFLQDIGAFQVGLGVVLLLAGLSVRADGLSIALLGVGVAAALHAVSHIVGRDLGGAPERDIPVFAAMAVVLRPQVGCAGATFTVLPADSGPPRNRPPLECRVERRCCSPSARS